MKRPIHWPAPIFPFLIGGLVFLFLLPTAVQGQQERKTVRQGNKLYEDKEYDQAIDAYNESLEINDQSYAAAFNLADALYQKGQFEEAASQFSSLARTEGDKERLGDIFHNIGNTFLEQQKYQEAVDAFKQGLRNDPKDEDTRYNLAYAQQKLIQQQQQQQEQQEEQQQEQDGDEEKDQDQNQDGEEGEEKEDQGENQNQGDEEKEDGQEKESQEGDNEEEQEGEEEKPEGDGESDQQGDKQGKQQPNPNELSKEDAERMLEALQNQEQDLQDKMDKKKRKTVNVLIEKDW